MVGIPHPAHGEEVGAAVALRPGADRHAATSCATTSRPGSRPTSTRGTCGWSTRCPRARPARSSSARSRCLPTSTAGACGHDRRACGPPVARARRASRGRAGPAADRRRARHRPGCSCPACRRCGSSARWPRSRGPIAARAGEAGGRAGPDRARHLDGRPGEAGPPLRRPGLDAEPVAAPGRAGLPGRRRAPPRSWSTTPISTGATPSGCGSSSPTCVEARGPVATTRCVSPVAWKAAIDSGGASVLSGLRNLARTWPPPRGCRRWCAPDAFQVGVDLAVTPGRRSCCAPRSSS